MLVSLLEDLVRRPVGGRRLSSESGPGNFRIGVFELPDGIYLDHSRTITIYRNSLNVNTSY
jgi:hypothetical protein